MAVNKECSESSRDFESSMNVQGPLLGVFLCWKKTWYYVDKKRIKVIFVCLFYQVKNSRQTLCATLLLMHLKN